jgi:hypothetical protein
MTATCTRLVVLGGTTRNPREAEAPQRELVQGVVGVRLEPQAISYTEGPLSPPADFWDALVGPDFDHSGFVVLHEAELQSDNTIIVKRDLFGKGDYPMTWAGWPIPGDPVELPEGAALPPTLVLTKAEKDALSLVRKARNGGTKTLHVQKKRNGKGY